MGSHPRREEATMRDDFSAERHHASVAALSIDALAPARDRGCELLPTIARGALTPPRLQAIAPAAARGLLRTTIADLRFSSTLVQGRAEEIANRARSGGAPHSLRLWRIGYEQALLSLAREVCRLGETSPCESLFWEQHGEEYYVSATFGEPGSAPRR
jgi:hypothetical protein